MGKGTKRWLWELLAGTESLNSTPTPFPQHKHHSHCCYTPTMALGKLHWCQPLMMESYKQMSVEISFCYPGGMGLQNRSLQKNKNFIPLKTKQNRTFLQPSIGSSPQYNPILFSRLSFQLHAPHLPYALASLVSLLLIVPLSVCLHNLKWSLPMDPQFPGLKAI